MSDLILNLKKKWFDQIRSGKKIVEYREIKSHWEKRLEGKTYDKILIVLGYPKTRTPENTIIFKWSGVKRILLKHEEFGNESKPVFAIPLVKE